jgi:hypothetical protein
VTYPDDRSRHGHLVHDAVASGREVKIVAYLEAGHNPITSSVMCRTPQQASTIATLLRDTMTADRVATPRAEEILRLADRLYPPPAPAAPPQWEYLTVLLAHLDHEELDRYGKDGWEAVCPLDPWGPGPALLFKRRLLAKSGDGG